VTYFGGQGSPKKAYDFVCHIFCIQQSLSGEIMKRMRFALAGSLMLALSPLQAADKPPAKYWMSVATDVGFGMGSMMGGGGAPGMGEMLGCMFGGGGGNMADPNEPKRSLLLQLVGPNTPADPNADEFIPPGQRMGEFLHLLTPTSAKLSRREVTSDESPETEHEKPKGRILMYWGCSDKIRAGQPKILDMATATPQQYASFFKAFNINSPRGPRPAAGWTYARWPHEKDNQQVPRDSSLIGSHTVKSNYAPEIRFNIPQQQDYMDPVIFTEKSARKGEAVSLRWKSIPNASGYFSMAMGGMGEGDMVIWVSSETPHMGWSLMDYVPTGEVNRLVKERVIMPTSTTECKIPKDAFKDGEGMLQFIAYGHDLNLSHPPKPQNAPKDWQPDWTAKVRLKSATMTMLGEEMGSGAKEDRGSGGRDYTSQPRSGRSRGNTDPIENPIKSIKGIFGL
jgi:hypothetical protein